MKSEVWVQGGQACQGARLMARSPHSSCPSAPDRWALWRGCRADCSRGGSRPCRAQTMSGSTSERPGGHHAYRCFSTLRDYSECCFCIAPWSSAKQKLRMLRLRASPCSIRDGCQRPEQRPLMQAAGHQPLQAHLLASVGCQCGHLLGAPCAQPGLCAPLNSWVCPVTPPCEISRM